MQVNLPVAASMISLVSAAVSVVSLLLARRVFQHQHEYARRQLAVQLIGQWDERTLIARQEVMRRWPDLFNRHMTIEWSEIEKVRTEQIARDQSAKDVDGKLLVTDHMTKILNFFELLATSSINHVADEDILKQSFGVTFNKWYLALEGFKEHVATARGYDPWVLVMELENRWARQASISKFPTGR